MWNNTIEMWNNTIGMHYSISSMHNNIVEMLNNRTTGDNASVTCRRPSRNTKGGKDSSRQSSRSTGQGWGKTRPS